MSFGLIMTDYNVRGDDDVIDSAVLDSDIARDITCKCIFRCRYHVNV